MGSNPVRVWKFFFSSPIYKINAMNNAVCLSYLLIELVSDILDIASYNRDKFILPVTIVSKEMVKKSMFD